MKYPAIYKTDCDELYLYISDCEFYCYSTSEWHHHIDYGDLEEHQKDKNITREYLKGKCVKVISPEHSEFVQKLAFNAGFGWHYYGNGVMHQDSKFLTFHNSGLIGKTNTPPCKTIGFELITIPLPPKAEPEPESKELPQIGTRVHLVSGANNISGELLALTNKYAIISQGIDEQHLLLNSWLFKNPKNRS